MKSVEELFWSKVRIGDGCWEWTGVVNHARGGYGQFSSRRLGGCATRRAHRVAWILTYGPVVDGLCVLHRCDNRVCVRPGHLFLGTRSDNGADMRAKGRSLAGERNVNAKLNDDAVRAIRRRRAAGESALSIAAAFGIPFQSVYSICKRERWGHVQDAAPHDGVRP
jgi:hypothetical protein